MGKRSGFLLVLLISINGCLGPNAVKTERIDFGRAVAETGREQLLLNIVRAHNHESPQFVDVSQVVNQSQLNGTITSSFPFPSGSKNPSTSGFTISSYDQPSVTYTPLLGSALVMQISQPITVDSIAALFDSEWPVGSLLTLVASHIAPSPTDREQVIDDLDYLAQKGVLTITAGKSAYTATGSQDDALLLFVDLSPQKALISKMNDSTRRVKHAHGEQARELQAWIDSHQNEVDEAAHIVATWKRLQDIFQDTYIIPTTVGIFPPPHSGHPSPANGTRDPPQYMIELRSVAATQPTLLGQKQVIPTLRTRSGLGVLMTATEGTEYVRFLTRDEFLKNWIYDPASPPEYVVEPTDGPSADHRLVPVQTPSGVIYVAASATGGPRKRHFIAIIHGPEHPTDGTYALTRAGGEYFYIDSGDLVSQRNFALIGQLLTMQSATPSAPTPTATITVGGH